MFPNRQEKKASKRMSLVLEEKQREIALFYEFAPLFFLKSKNVPYSGIGVFNLAQFVAGFLVR
jgi:hypothetical protein